MAIGGLVAIPELQAEGPARLIEQRQGWCTIRFLTSGAEMTVEQHSVMRYVLLPDTPVRVRDGAATISGQITAPMPTRSADARITYGLRLADGSSRDICESTIASVPAARDPGAQLAQVAFHDLSVTTTKTGKARPPSPWGPQTLCARETVLQWADQVTQAAGGILGLPGARIDLLPHQVLTAARVLADGRVRFLLADEVGLGKTIEAGLIMQSLLAMNPHLRVLVVVPGALVSQWFVELFVKFGGRRFTMYDGERLSGSSDPWAEQCCICSARALEDCSPRDALRFATSSWDLVIMDECHRMQPQGILYQRMAVLSKRTPHVLLLSATPPRQHADAYLALLHLLQPDAYPLDGAAAFRAKLAGSQTVAAIIRACDHDPAAAQALASEHLADDEQLHDLLAAGQHGAAATWLREHYIPDHRVIRHRRRSLQRMAEHSGVKALALGLRTRTWCDYESDPAERAVRQALGAYRQTLLKPWAADPTTAPPRLLHWLLQLDLALAAHPRQLERLVAMRQAVVEDPEAVAEYRLRALPGESLAMVMRGDLSESEAASQIAISASCAVEQQLEAPLLDTLAAACRGWSATPARITALLKAMRAFWKEHPQEKILVFTNHGLALQAVRDILAKRLGANHVADFGGHQDAEEREAAATRFRTVEECWVLVCDALGGEGRNFQFVSMVAHVDLPWSISAIEQRIGRVDRLGRDGEVISLVCRCRDADAIDGAWATVVDDAVGVFARSSSGLEFLSARFEEEALRATINGGAEGLRAQSTALIAAVAAERELVESEEDDAFAAGAAAFVEAQGIADRLRAIPAPVGAICRWLRGMGGQVRSEDGPQPHYQLRPRGSDEWIDGVFAAAAAQRNERDAFFARGHQVIDTLVDDAAAADWCQANAWRRTGSAQWEGLRCSLRVHLDVVAIAQAGLPLEVLRRVWMALPPAPQWCCVTMDGRSEERPAILEDILQPFNPQRGDQVLSNRVSRSLWMQPLVSGKAAQIAGWQQRVRRAYAAAEERGNELSAAYVSAALSALDQRFDQQLALVRGRCAAAERQLGAAHPDVARLRAEVADEERQAEALRASVAGARCVITSASYLTMAAAGPA